MPQPVWSGHTRGDALRRTHPPAHAPLLLGWRAGPHRVYGVLSLGRYVSPLPVPRKNHQLVTSGMYSECLVHRALLRMSILKLNPQAVFCVCCSCLPPASVWQQATCATRSTAAC
jgi:hypothetical protein